jgi:hypothetical protein
VSQTGSAGDRLLVCHEPIPTHLRPVLIALLSGATDGAACRRLGVSGRTYSRRLADLLDYFESQTRFQAGVKFGLSGRATFADDRAMPVARVTSITARKGAG